ncbi:MAG: TIGR03067 domain-containing protein [Planctomycetaceae bacterium]
MFRHSVVGLLCLTCAMPIASAQDSVQEMIGKANRLVQNEDFAGAAKLLREAVKEDEKNSEAWLMLGYSLHMNGDLDEAIKAHEKTASMRATRGIGNYNLGCAYALKGKKDKAFSYLNKAVKANFAERQQFDNDDDLKSLREDVRYKRLVMRIEGEDVTDDFGTDGMVGRWVMVAATKNGEKEESPKGVSEVSKDTYTMTADDKTEGPVPYKLDVSTVVPTITIAGQLKGILKMSGDKLTICMNPAGLEAPKKFESTEENGFTTMVVRRAVTPGRLIGTWAYESGSRAGEKVSAERLAGAITVTENKFTIPAGPTDKFIMKYSIKSNAKFDMIDLEIESGPAPEGKALGIVRIEGDTMMFCYDSTGMKRPTDFKTTEEDGFFMFTLKRSSDSK